MGRQVRVVTDIRTFVEARLAEQHAAIENTEDPFVVLERVWSAALAEQMRLKQAGGMGSTDDYEARMDAHLDRARLALAVGDLNQARQEVAAKRHVLDRHKPRADPWTPRACDGCGTHLEWGEPEPDSADVNDCPELRDLAAVWSDHPHYNPTWKPEP